MGERSQHIAVAPEIVSYRTGDFCEIADERLTVRSPHPPGRSPSNFAHTLNVLKACDRRSRSQIRVFFLAQTCSRFTGDAAHLTIAFAHSRVIR